MLTQTRKNEIEAAAKDLLSGTYTNVDESIVPIDIREILDLYKIPLKFVEFKDESISGAFEMHPQAIYVNTDDSFPRKTFTIAHELGHLILHEKKEQEVFYRVDIARISEEDKQEEQEANWFAASLLMPESVIKKYWSLTKDIEKLAKIFGSSPSAVYYRLKNLGLTT
jgi:Zn-dependent peptidase ImmA (M78 family)